MCWKLWAARLQWGRRFSSAEMATLWTRTAQNAELQWGRRLSSAEIRRRSVGRGRGAARFNGAADFHRRKCVACEGEIVEGGDASMGPPIFIGGNACIPCSHNIGGPCFNGAADFHRRKCETDCAASHAADWLQWGRRFSSAEIMLRAFARLCALDGFNGAADFHRRK